MNSGTLNSDQPKETEVPFEFGKNWSSFLSVLNRERIEAAENSLRQLLELDDSRSRRFLDAGCGSGLFSLAAYRLDAEVTSFDVDRASTECVRELKRRYAAETTRWKIFDGSLLDERFLQGLGTFDVVYCWGVAHHTGNMWRSIENLIPLVSDGSLFVLAIYNDQLYVSKVWRGVKKNYQRLPGMFRPLLVFGVWLTMFLKRFTITILACLARLFSLRNPLTPISNWLRETKSRGMHGWYDLVDWVGGWPFEVARPEEIFRFMRDRGFVLQELTTSTGHGCNEFVFRRLPSRDRSVK